LSPCALPPLIHRSVIGLDVGLAFSSDRLVLSLLERRAKNEVFRCFVERASPPTMSQLAAALGVDDQRAWEACAGLARAHVLVVDPKRRHIDMALPFSGVPTPHRTVAGEHSWFANCAWDVLGVLAALDRDGEAHSRCADCEEPIALTVHGGEVRGEAVMHVAVPAAEWWADIRFT
jgi:hypothetical protein